MGTPWTDRFGDNLDELLAIPWWLFIVTGALWMVFAFIVLSFDFRTVFAVALFAGVVFIVAGLNEFMTASMVPRRQWLHVGLGVLFIGAGIFAIAWPTITFVALAAIIGWFLLFGGAFDIVGALMDRHDLWWLRLIAGVIEVALGVWAIGYPGRSFTLLAVWVAAAALTRGFIQILFGIALRDAGRQPFWSGAGEDQRQWPTGNGQPQASGRDGDRNNGNGRKTDVRDQRIIDEFRSSGGHVGGDLAGEQVLLVHSTDSNGREQVSPVSYEVEGDRFIIYPLGRDQGGVTPEWYANLLADTHGRVETGQNSVDVEAHVPNADEQQRLRRSAGRSGTGSSAADRVTGSTAVLILELVQN